MNAIDDVPASPETDLAQSLRSVVALAGIAYSAAGVPAGSEAGRSRCAQAILKGRASFRPQMAIS